MNDSLLEIDDYVSASFKDRSVAHSAYIATPETLTLVHSRAQLQYASYLERARKGDGAAFRMICKITADTHIYKSVFGLEGSKRPKDWQHLVTRFIDNPTVKEYRFGDVKDGFIRNYAAIALADRSLHMVKVSLAYCNQIVFRHISGKNQLDYHIRHEVGEILMTELAKMKVELEREPGANISYS